MPLKGRCLATGTVLALLSGCGSVTTVTKHAPTLPSATGPAAHVAPKAHKASAIAALNNPAQQPDSSATAYCNEVAEGHACHAVTTTPSDPNESPQRNCDTNIVAKCGWIRGRGHSSAVSRPPPLVLVVESPLQRRKHSASVSAPSITSLERRPQARRSRSAPVRSIRSPATTSTFADRDRAVSVGFRFAGLRTPGTRESGSTVRNSPSFAPLATYGRYWARTSDLRLVEAALSQLS